MGKLWQDVRFGARMLAKSPGFAAVTVLALALGIGANTAIFSVVNGVLLRPLPYRNAERLVFLGEWSRQIPEMSVSWPNFVDWRAQNHSFDAMGAFRSGGYVLTGAGEPERLTAREVSHEFFPALGVSPMAGRDFAEADDKPGAEKTVLLSYGVWQRRFGGDPSVVGRPLTLNNESYTIVGVLPKEFQWQASVDIYVPLGTQADRMQSRGNHPGIYVVALLKPGVTVAAARDDMKAITTRLAEQFPKEIGGNSFTLETLQDTATKDIRSSLWVLMAAVGFVLLIACANVANLLLARAASRSREIAIRTALGAGRARIVRQLLTESVLLAIAGGALGALLASWGVAALVSSVSDTIPLVILQNIRLDSRVLAFTLGVSVLTGLLFGLAPAIHSSRSNLNESLKEGGRSGSEGAARHRVRNFLVVAEVAISLLLLVGSGLLIKSFMNLRHADLGFDPDHVLTMRVSLPEARYKENPQIENFYTQLLQRVKTLPGVESAGLTVGLPMNGGIESSIRVEGKEVNDPRDAPVAVTLSVSPEYLRAMDIRLVQGRYFTEQDREGTTPVVIVDDTLAARFFPGEPPLGKRLHVGGGDLPGMRWMEIVGVVRHVKHYSPDEEGRVEIYRPYNQFPFEPDAAFLKDEPPIKYPRGMSLAVRSNSDPAALAASIRGVVREIDPDLPVSFVQSMNEIVAQTISPQKFATWMLGLFAGVALLLAALGIYGVMAYSVTQRTHEIGIRMALGAKRADVLRMILGQGMRLTLVGVGLGLVGAFAVTRALSAMLFGVKATDPLTYGGVAVLLAGVALLSCLLPARRATKVDPMIALRYE
jgi:putative ABC transport system permease protein